MFVVYHGVGINISYDVFYSRIIAKLACYCYLASGQSVWMIEA